MKNILVPIDFSENARNALAYAIDLAGRFQGKIFLLHAYRVPTKTGVFASFEEQILGEIRPEMKEWEDWTRERLGEGSSVTSFLVRDDVEHAVSALAGKQAIDLIVMGTQGASGIREVFLGSNTSAVLNYAALPLLAVPEGCKNCPLKTIVFAVDDLDIVSSEALQPLIKLGRGLPARILVYHLEEEEDTGVDPALEALLEGIDHSFHFEPGGGDVNERINQFARQYKGDLLVMLRRQKGFFQRLFQGSVTTKEVFNSPVPLLVLIEKGAG
ncbi:MAG: universal stress protein [Saprospiraceae bacterium]